MKERLFIFLVLMALVAAFIGLSWPLGPASIPVPVTPSPTLESETPKEVVSPVLETTPENPDATGVQPEKPVVSTPEGKPKQKSTPDADFFSLQAVINGPISGSMEKKEVNYAELQQRLKRVSGPAGEKAVLQQRATALGELQHLLYAHAHPQAYLAAYRKKYKNPDMDAARCKDHIKREINNFRQDSRLTPTQQNSLILWLNSH